MFVKFADLSATSSEPDWAAIIQTYEKVIAIYLRKDILRMSAKGLMIKTVLSSIAFDDVVGAEKKLDTFKFDDPSLEGSREGEVLANIIEAVKSNDKKSFDAVLKEYNRVTPFQRVEKSILAAIVDTFNTVSGGVESGELELPDDNEEDGELDLR